MKCDDSDGHPGPDEEDLENGGPIGGGGRVGQSSISGNAQIQNITKQLKNIANKVNTSIPGKGAAVGTQKHAQFKTLVDKLGIKNLRTEVSYLNSKEVSYGTKGSVRYDVVLVGQDSKPICAWDFKTGSA